MKVIFDLTHVVLSVLFSFLFLHSLQGVREGTLASAALVGQTTKFFSKFIR